MVINNNLSAMNANRNLGINQSAQSSSMEKLSSGLRINRAGDDAAGLAISEKMRNQIAGLEQASRNAQDGISLIQTAEGALGETHEMLQRMRELSIQSLNDTYTVEDREKIDLEIQQLLEEIDGIAEKTEFNDQSLLSGMSLDEIQAMITAGPKTDTGVAIGTTSLQAALTTISNDTSGKYDGMSTWEAINDATTNWTAISAEITALANSGYDVYSKTFEFHVGVNENQKISVDIMAMSTDSLGLTGIDSLSKEAASASLEAIDAAIETVSTQRALLGAVQNRLEHTIKNVDNTAENLQSAESNIRDTDMASEMMEYTKYNILSQASQSMLAQANQTPQQVLQLLG